MTSDLKVFVDSDVLISSLISQKGAAYLLLYQTNLKLFISNFSQKETEGVINKLNLPKDKFRDLIKKRLQVVKLSETTKEFKDKYKNYTSDQNDTHIVAGSVLANANFLITYNIRDFKVDIIKSDFRIICLTPAQFLQYLRSK